MKYENPKLQQMLAAEYVLGTLHGRARTRFQRLLRNNEALVREVRNWERCLTTFADRIPPQAPSPLVWTKIDRRIHGSRGAAPYVATRQRADAWRTLALAASVACVGLGFALWRQINAGPQIVEVTKIVSVPQPMPYVAVLQPGGDLKFVLALSPEKRLIKVAVSGQQPPVDYLQRSLELWVLDEQGKPHSLGVMPHSGVAEMPMPEGAPMPKAPTLAISDEPRGGSPTGSPTGPVLTAGPALQAL